MNLDLYYSPEVEEALVTLVWHKPQFLGYVLRSLSPPVHILQEHLRFILEAIQLSQDLLGETTFETVVQALREDGRYQACGEMVGLDAIYGRSWDSAIEPSNAQRILDYYIELLKRYAAKRQTASPQEVIVFSGGKGTLSLNKNKQNDKSPDYIGWALIRGRKYKRAGWISADGESIHESFYAC